ncbi:MAG: superoxide dismutase family protein [Lachnospiraceae bacterium]|nr:superoxide dismutase family protein [Lachnospiraceae bacterium]
MNPVTPASYFIDTLSQTPPDAVAWISGNQDHPDLYGNVFFYQTSYIGLLIQAELFNLPFSIQTPNPQSQPQSQQKNQPQNLFGNEINSFGSLTAPSFYGMHIHQIGDCTLPFDQTGEHYNPNSLPHPKHAGDLPPLLGNEGYAFSIFYTESLTLSQIIGRSIIIHQNPDDFTTQPAGSSGEKIGCGVIQWG